MIGEQVSNAQAKASLAVERLELAGAAVDVDRELVVLGLVHGSGIDELAHEIGGHLVRLVLLLQSMDLLLQLLDHGELSLDVRLLLRCGLLVSLDLGQSASSLGADLEHVR